MDDDLKINKGFVLNSFLDNPMMTQQAYSYFFIPHNSWIVFECLEHDETSTNIINDATSTKSIIPNTPRFLADGRLSFALILLLTIADIFVLSTVNIFSNSLIFGCNQTTISSYVILVTL